MGRILSLVIALVVFSLSASHARADDDFVKIPDPVLRLDAVLHTQRDRGELRRITLGASIAVLGAAATGGGIAIAALASDDTVRMLGVILASGGVAYLILGIGDLMVPTPPEDRWRQWVSLRTRGAVTRDEISRYEGELRLEARQEAFGRVIGEVAGFGFLALGGGVAVGALLLPMTPSSSANVPLAIAGIGIGVAGLLLSLLALLIEPPTVKELRMYLHGYAPRRHDAPTVQVAPLVGPSSLGIGVAGTF